MHIELNAYFSQNGSPIFFIKGITLTHPTSPIGLDPDFRFKRLRKPEPTTLLNLPKELSDKIFSYLNASDIKTFRSASMQSRTIIFETNLEKLFALLDNFHEDLETIHKSASSSSSLEEKFDQYKNSLQNYKNSCFLFFKNSSFQALERPKESLSISPQVQEKRQQLAKDLSCYLEDLKELNSPLNSRELDQNLVQKLRKIFAFHDFFQSSITTEQNEFLSKETKIQQHQDSTITFINQFQKDDKIIPLTLILLNPSPAQMIIQELLFVNPSLAFKHLTRFSQQEIDNILFSLILEHDSIQALNHQRVSPVSNLSDNTLLECCETIKNDSLRSLTLYRCFLRHAFNFSLPATDANNSLKRLVNLLLKESDETLRIIFHNTNVNMDITSALFIAKVDTTQQSFTKKTIDSYIQTFFPHSSLAIPGEPNLDLKPELIHKISDILIEQKRISEASTLTSNYAKSIDSPKIITESILYEAILQIVSKDLIEKTFASIFLDFKTGNHVLTKDRERFQQVFSIADSLNTFINDIADLDLAMKNTTSRYFYSLYENFLVHGKEQALKLIEQNPFFIQANNHALKLFELLPLPKNRALLPPENITQTERLTFSIFSKEETIAIYKSLKEDVEFLNQKCPPDNSILFNRLQQSVKNYISTLEENSTGSDLSQTSVKQDLFHHLENIEMSKKSAPPSLQYLFSVLEANRKIDRQLQRPLQSKITKTEEIRDTSYLLASQIKSDIQIISKIMTLIKPIARPYFFLAVLAFKDQNVTSELLRKIPQKQSDLLLSQALHSLCFIHTIDLQVLMPSILIGYEKMQDQSLKRLSFYKNFAQHFPFFINRSNDLPFINLILQESDESLSFLLRGTLNLPLDGWQKLILAKIDSLEGPFSKEKVKAAFHAFVPSITENSPVFFKFINGLLITLGYQTRYEDILTLHQTMQSSIKVKSYESKIALPICIKIPKHLRTSLPISELKKAQLSQKDQFLLKESQDLLNLTDQFISNLVSAVGDLNAFLDKNYLKYPEAIYCFNLFDIFFERGKAAASQLIEQNSNYGEINRASLKIFEKIEALQF